MFIIFYEKGKRKLCQFQNENQRYKLLHHKKDQLFSIRSLIEPLNTHIYIYICVCVCV